MSFTWLEFLDTQRKGGFRVLSCMIPWVKHGPIFVGDHSKVISVTVSSGMPNFDPSNDEFHEFHDVYMRFTHEIRDAKDVRRQLCLFQNERLGSTYINFLLVLPSVEFRNHQYIQTWIAWVFPTCRVLKLGHEKVMSPAFRSCFQDPKRRMVNIMVSAHFLQSSNRLMRNHSSYSPSSSLNVA